MNKFLAVAIGLVTVYAELATGGAQAEAEKILGVLLSLSTTAGAANAVAPAAVADHAAAAQSEAGSAIIETGAAGA